MPIFKYSRSFTGATNAYGILTSIPDYMKKSSVTLNLEVQIVCNSSAAGWRTSAGFSFKRKISGGTESVLATDSTTSSTGGTINYTSTYSTTMDLSSATKLGFLLTTTKSQTHTDTSIGPSSFSPTVTFYWIVKLTTPSYSANDETVISADLANELVGVLGTSSKATKNSVIKIAPYSALATAAGSAAFDTTNPKKANLTSLLTAVNANEITKSYDSTSSSDY